MVEVKRKNGESIERLLHRFTRRLQQSRKLLKVKQSQYYEKPLTKREIKLSALHRKKVREKMEYLRKIGRLPEDEEKWEDRKFRR